MTMSNYRKNKAKAVFRNTAPSMTDQSQIDDTNVNIIMKKYRITGVAPGPAKQPMFGDFTELPGDLRTLMEQAKRLPDYIASLPEQLKGMPMDQLLALNAEQLGAILKPADKPADKPTDTTT